MLSCLIDAECLLQNKDEARNLFPQLTGLYQNRNDSPVDFADFGRYRREIERLAEQYGGVASVSAASGDMPLVTASKEKR